MPTILIRLAAPLMSWGNGNRMTHHPTDTRPTKSGVIGLVAAALGRHRDDDISDLSAMRFGVTVIHPGRIVTDLQTMGSRADGQRNPLQRKDYIADGEFIAGLETDDAQLSEQIVHAFKHPAFTLFLGRMSCPPAGPIRATTTSKPLAAALREHGNRIYMETVSTGDIRWDQPFGQGEYGARNEDYFEYAERMIAA